MRTNRLMMAAANIHNEPEGVEYVRTKMRAGYAAVGVMESQRAFANVTIPETRTAVAGRHWEEERDRERSTRIITDIEAANIGEFTRLVSEKVQAYEELAPDRVFVASLFEHPVARRAGADGIAFGMIHPSVAGVLRDPDEKRHPITREYREALMSTRLFMRSFRRDGLLLVLGMDGQMPASTDVPWHPLSMIGERLNLQAVNRGLDYMFVDRRLEVAGTHFTRMHDHWAVEVSLNARRAS